MQMGITVPMVVEQEGQVERAFDIYSRLLKDRIVILGTPVDYMIANLLMAELLYLQSVDPQKDVNLYVNCPGGDVIAGLAIYDTIQMLSCDVCTFCIGQASSMGALLLAAGTKGKRFALPHSRIMIHQPWGGTQGTAADIHLQAREILRNRDLVNGLLAKHTGQDLETIAKDTQRDRFMSAEEAKEYGLVDAVMSRDSAPGAETKDANDTKKKKD